MKVIPIVFVLLLALSACSKPAATISQSEAAQYRAAFDAAKMSPEIQAKWARSCALCHVAGQGGAPRVGHADEWAPRLKQGEAVLMQHTLDGYNSMPPLGYCMGCEMTDFAAMLDMMSGRKQ